MTRGFARVLLVKFGCTGPLIIIKYLAILRWFASSSAHQVKEQKHGQRHSAITIYVVTEGGIASVPSNVMGATLTAGLQRTALLGTAQRSQLCFNTRESERAESMWVTEKSAGKPEWQKYRANFWFFHTGYQPMIQFCAASGCTLGEKNALCVWA